jgi:CRP-like cAMP-binding protein
MASSTDLDLNTELRLVPSFTELTKEAHFDLVASASQRRAHAGVVLVEQGVPSNACQILLRGAAKIVRTAPAKTGDEIVVLDVMRAPCLMADASIIDGQPAMASIVTLRSSQVASIDRRSVARLMALHPTLARAFLARATAEARSHVRRIDEIVAGPVDERIVHLLESLSEQHGTPLGQGRFIAIPLRRRDLACMVNATTETVSRLLAKFEREGQARSTRDGIWWRSGRASMSSSAPPVSAMPSAPPSSDDASDGSMPPASGESVSAAVGFGAPQR